jgi:hypothetical protein
MVSAMKHKIPKFISILHAVASGWRPTGCKFGHHPGEMRLLAGPLLVSIYHSVDRQQDAKQKTASIL